MKYIKQESKNESLITFDKPLTTQANSIHPVSTTLDLGYLGTHNSHTNIRNNWNHSPTITREEGI